ncbi:MAG: hypothetical protein M3R01_13520 [Actinomycetota bacterium]|nr:hypothetical protein [Actinomycetota bacterium]
MPELYERTPILGIESGDTVSQAGDLVGSDGNSLAVMIEGDPEKVTADIGTFTGHIGTCVSTDGGRTFSSFGTADQVVIAARPERRSTRNGRHRHR